MSFEKMVFRCIGKVSWNSPLLLRNREDLSVTGFTIETIFSLRDDIFQMNIVRI